MLRQIGLVWIVAFVGSFSAAGAQTPPPSTAGAAFDGTYALVSSARVNQTFMTRKGQVGQCPDRRPGPLTVARGRARYKSATGYRLRGTVRPQGELTMRAEEPGGAREMDLDVRGSIAANGTVRARQEGNSCSYDFVWQKDGQQTSSAAGRSLSIVSSPASRRAG